MFVEVGFDAVMADTTSAFFFFAEPVCARFGQHGLT